MTLIVLQSQEGTIPSLDGHGAIFSANWHLSSPTRIGLRVAALLGIASGTLAGQDLSVHGRVADTDGHPVTGAIVNATALPDSTTRRTFADSVGRFSVLLPVSASSYVVDVWLIGYTATRREVPHTPGDTVGIVVDMRLSHALQRLAPVTTHAQRPKPLREEQRGEHSPGQPTRLVGPIDLSDGLTGDLTGDLASALATMPGVTVIPSAGDSPSIAAFGFSGDQNGTTLNGMSFSGSSLPRDGFTVSALSSTYDPSKGGFAGLLTSARLRAGTNRSARVIHGSLDSPMLQLGQSGFGNRSARRAQDVVSGAVSGPIVTDHLFYNSVYQFVRRLPAAPSLSSASNEALRALGIAPDSLARFLSAAQTEGVPTLASADHSILQASVYTRLDYQPRNPEAGMRPGVETGFIPSDDQYSILIGGGLRQAHTTVPPTSFPTLGGLANGWNEQLSLTRSTFALGWLLNESSLSFGTSFDRILPAVVAPSVQVGLTSLADTGEPTRTAVLAGGAGVEPSSRRTWSAEVRNQTSWETWNRAHQSSITLDGLVSGYKLVPANSLGGFVFNSLGDFESGLPAGFTRAAPTTGTQGRSLDVALAFGDIYAPAASGSPAHHLAVQYGLRAEVSGFATRIPRNDEVAAEFGIRTDELPREVAVLPMVGFNREFGSFHRTSTVVQPRGSFFGGIREYRSSPAASTLDQHQRQTGLVGSAEDISCVGSGVPVPDWPAYVQSPASVPDGCVSAAPASFNQIGRPVIAYGPGYRFPTSWRPVLGFGAFFTKRWSGMASGTLAWNRNRTDLVDLNFSGRPQFRLASEGERPVYVPASDIVDATGAVLDRDSRVDDSFTHVNEVRSDLSDKFGQFTVALIHAPDAILSPYATLLTQTIAYTFNAARTQTRGFSATTTGDPRLVEWTSGQTSRHAFILTQLVRNQHFGQLTFFGRLASGLPYTPIVNSDINGDGYSNDRAFIFNPSAARDTMVATGMAALIQSAPRQARRCLARQMGTVAAANSCIGGWSANLNVAYSPSNSLINVSERGRISLLLTNAAGALDYVLHGQSHLHRWGTPAIADPVLLQTRGFDQTSERFLYSVNPSFGRGSRFAIFNPVSVSLDLRIDLGPDRESAAIGSFLQPGPVSALPYLTTDEIRARLLSSRTTPFDQVLRLRDSLQLSDSQVLGLRHIASAYSRERDSIYSELSTFLGARAGDYAGNEVKEHWHNASVRTMLSLRDHWLELRELISPTQYAIIPESLRSRYDVSRAAVERGMRGPIFFPP